MNKLLLTYCVVCLLAYPAYSRTLNGGVSNSYGRVGILVNNASNRVTKTHKRSPASGLIYEGDLIIEADGYKGASHIDGTAGSSVTIRIQRKCEVKEFTLIRVPKDQISD